MDAIAPVSIEAEVARRGFVLVSGEPRRLPNGWPSPWLCVFAVQGLLLAGAAWWNAPGWRLLGVAVVITLAGLCVELWAAQRAYRVQGQAEQPQHYTRRKQGAPQT